MPKVDESHIPTREAPAGQPARRALFLAGAMFWIAVCAAGVVAWMSWRSSQRQLPEGSAASDDVRSALPPKPPFREYDLPEFSLAECRGGTVTKNDLLGRPAVICFVFTRCTGQCKRVDDQMRRMQELTASTDTRLVTITVDPQYDTAGVLKRHAEALNADPQRWWFLTGEQDVVYRLIQHGFQLSVVQNSGAKRKPGDEVSHSDAVLYVSKSGRIIGKYSGSIPAEMAKLRRRIQRDFRDAQSPSTKGAGRGR